MHEPSLFCTVGIRSPWEAPGSLWHTELPALTSISSQIKGDVTVQKTIFLEFILIVQVIDFKLLQVTRGLGSPITLYALVGKEESEIKTRTGATPWGQPRRPRLC